MAVQFNEFYIQDFRGIESLELKNLSSVNVILGGNNCGKTSVLEAISLYCHGTMTGVSTVARRREQGMYRMSDHGGALHLFSHRNLDMSNLPPIVLKEGVTKSDGNQKVETFSLTGDLYSRIFRTEGHYDPFGEWVDPQEEEDLVLDCTINGTKVRKDAVKRRKYRSSSMTTVLKKEPMSYPHVLLGAREIPTLSLMPVLQRDSITREWMAKMAHFYDKEITNIISLTDKWGREETKVIRSTGPDLPLSMYGDGLKKALAVTAALIVAEGGVLLVDEFETGFQMKGFKKVLKSFFDLADEMDVQLFLSTHSLEAVDKLLNLEKEYIEDMSIYRLRKKEGTVVKKTYTGKEARFNRDHYGMELRL